MGRSEPKSLYERQRSVSREELEMEGEEALEATAEVSEEIQELLNE